MAKNSVSFSDLELNLMQDAAFFQNKKIITAKVIELFRELAQSLSQTEFNEKKLSEIFNVDFQGAKISKGEKFHDLPYLVLDFPRCFSSKGVFCLRSMFWWGNYWSFSVHIQGGLLDDLKNKSSYGCFDINENVFVGTGDKAWDYNFNGTSFKKYQAHQSEQIKAHLKDMDYLKIGITRPINTEPHALITSGSQFYENMLQQLLTKA